MAGQNLECSLENPVIVICLLAILHKRVHPVAAENPMLQFIGNDLRQQTFLGIEPLPCKFFHHLIERRKELPIV